MTNLRMQLEDLVGNSQEHLESWKQENGYVVGGYLLDKLRGLLKQGQCKHKYVLDEEHPNHYCCQDCGHVRTQGQPSVENPTVPKYPTREMWQAMPYTSTYVSFERFEDDYSEMLKVAMRNSNV